MLLPATVAYLLGLPGFNLDETHLSDEIDLPLADLVRNAEKLCTGEEALTCGLIRKMEHVSKWIGCVAAFAQAGVDPSMRDKDGQVGTRLPLGEYLAYTGPNRFRRHLATQLRLQLGKECTADRPDPLACYEALRFFLSSARTITNPGSYRGVIATYSVRPHVTSWPPGQNYPITEAGKEPKPRRVRSPEPALERRPP
ncbi:hypothetical protein VTK26DRAFT_9307 [Humicola hyalothermophila]